MLLSAVVTVLASGTAEPQDAPGSEAVSPGLGGFLVMFFLAVATVLLVRSMVGHLRKVRYSPEPPDPGGPDDVRRSRSGTGAQPPDPDDDRR